MKIQDQDYRDPEPRQIWCSATVGQWTRHVLRVECGRVTFETFGCREDQTCTLAEWHEWRRMEFATLVERQQKSVSLLDYTEPYDNTRRFYLRLDDGKLTGVMPQNMPKGLIIAIATMLAAAKGERFVSIGEVCNETGQVIA